MSDPWFTYGICVPFGDPHYDSGLGGSHDLDVGAPPNYPVTALLPGVVSSITAPPWGRQVGIHLDSAYNGIPYLSFLHLSAVHPSLKIGSHVGPGDLIGWVGGASDPAQYAGTSNPTGQNFLNDPSQSSRVQVGIALMRGPEYGVGAGWVEWPVPAIPHFADPLNPTSIIAMALQFHKAWFSTPAAWYSGIHKFVFSAFMERKVSACFPLQAENPNNDWDLRSIQFQALSNGLYVAWNNNTGECHLYDAFNHVII